MQNLLKAVVSQSFRHPESHPSMTDQASCKNIFTNKYKNLRYCLYIFYSLFLLILQVHKIVSVKLLFAFYFYFS